MSIKTFVLITLNPLGIKFELFVMTKANLYNRAWEKAGLIVAHQLKSFMISVVLRLFVAITPRPLDGIIDELYLPS